MPKTLNSDLRELEAQLTSLSPSAMPEDMLARMENAMINWESHLPVEEKILHFEKVAPVKSQSKLHIWGAAAAVALMAAVGAVFMSGPDTTEQLALVDSIPAAEATPDFSHNIINASSEGITYAGKDKTPYKVLRLKYTVKVKTKDKDGNYKTVTKPAVKTILIPIEVN